MNKQNYTAALDLFTALHNHIKKKKSAGEEIDLTGGVDLKQVDCCIKAESLGNLPEKKKMNRYRNTPL